MVLARVLTLCVISNILQTISYSQLAHVSSRKRTKLVSVYFSPSFHPLTFFQFHFVCVILHCISLSSSHSSSRLLIFLQHHPKFPFTHFIAAPCFQSSSLTHSVPLSITFLLRFFPSSSFFPFLTH